MGTGELRLKNLVLWDGKVVSIDLIATDTVNVLDKNSITGWYTVNDKEIQPIELTEEWLIKFRFKKYTHEPIEGEEDKCEEYCISKLSIVDWGHGFIMSNSFSFTLRIELKYVHQLQNLYFALTGEELQLN